MLYRQAVPGAAGMSGAAIDVVAVTLMINMKGIFIRSF
jgi:hypothetical protein